MRFATLLALMALVPGCFNPDDKAETAGADTEGETDGPTDGNSDGNTDGDPTVGSDSNSDSSPTDPSGTDTNPTTGDESTGTTGTDAVCGDGEVTGDEVCDDGVNDGAYGGCMQDCSGMAEFCGDGDLNGPETCDDGVNDGAYGGCNADCTVGPACGDGEVDGPELCDEGADNENGSGCNVDCTTSGTLIGELLQTGMTFCDGAFTTDPQFDADGNALVSASGYCGGDTQLLQALTPEVEIEEEFEALLPSTPMREATMLGDTWLLAASDCNYLIDDGGAFTEVCDEARITGYSGLDAVDADNYYALGYQEAASFGAGSPAIGDAPTWLQAVPPAGFYEYDWRALTEGPNGSVIVAGRRRNTNDGTSVGYFTQFTTAGNTADTNTYSAITDVTDVVAGPDGSLLLYTGYPNYILLKLNPAFGQEWSLTLTNPGDVQMAFDSAGEILVLHEDGNGNGSYELRKLDSGDGMERWSLALPEISYDPRIAVAPDDYTWVASAGYGGEGGQLWVGRVTP